MNNKYLYKAKRTDNGEWVEGYYAFVDNVHYIYTGALCNGGLYVIAERFEVNPSTICQCIGSTDKNGKKIWENDILRSDLNKVGRVAFNETHLAYTILEESEMKYYFLCDCDSQRVEVIGNIFDNPELLKGGAE